jgi:hypothetical protein
MGTLMVSSWYAHGRLTFSSGSGKNIHVGPLSPLEMKALASFKRTVKTNAATQRNRSQNLNPQLCRCGKLRSGNISLDLNARLLLSSVALMSRDGQEWGAFFERIFYQRNYFHQSTGYQLAGYSDEERKGLSAFCDLNRTSQQIRTSQDLAKSQEDLRTSQEDVQDPRTFQQHGRSQKLRTSQQLSASQEDLRTSQEDLKAPRI